MTKSMEENLVTTLEAQLIRWRKHRNFSQLALACEANVSQRHISYIETGRSKPSREMLMRLCDVMLVPFRERNTLLSLAGFSAMYQESSLQEPTMRPILNAIESMLLVHNPFPALVVDRFWNIIQQNEASDRFFSELFNSPEIQSVIQQEGRANLALLTLHPKGLRRYIKNWEEVSPVFVNRLSHEVNYSGDAAVRKKLATFLTLSGLVTQDMVTQDFMATRRDLLPVVPLKLSVNENDLSLFSIISTIGTPQDITTDELRVESFYPTDDASRAYFESLARC